MGSSEETYFVIECKGNRNDLALSTRHSVGWWDSEMQFVRTHTMERTIDQQESHNVSTCGEWGCIVENNLIPTGSCRHS